MIGDTLTTWDGVLCSQRFDREADRGWSQSAGGSSELSTALAAWRLVVTAPQSD